jgi:hypothetical protein
MRVPAAGKRIAEQESHLPGSSSRRQTAGVKKIGLATGQARLRKNDDVSPRRGSRGVVEGSDRKAKSNQLFRFDACAGDRFKLLLDFRLGGLPWRFASCFSPFPRWAFPPEQGKRVNGIASRRPGRYIAASVFVTGHDFEPALSDAPGVP